jgi:hypothetical protein
LTNALAVLATANEASPTTGRVESNTKTNQSDQSQRRQQANSDLVEAFLQPDREGARRAETDHVHSGRLSSVAPLVELTQLLLQLSDPAFDV